MLIQIEEAHSSAWPVGLVDQPEPHSSFAKRLEVANTFNTTEQVPYPILVDNWDNAYEQQFRAWPDKYYLIKPTNGLKGFKGFEGFMIVAKSTYGKRRDALLDLEWIEIIKSLY